MKNVIAAVQGIDWAMLRRQKREVCKLDEGFTSNARDGVLALLDSIQDAYVADGMATVSEVFGTKLVEVQIPVFITCTVVDVNTEQDAILVGWGNSFDWELALPEDTHDYTWDVSEAMICDATNLVTGEETEHQMHDDGVIQFQSGSNSYELKYYGFITVEVDNAESVEDAIRIAMGLDFGGEMKPYSKHCTKLDWTYSDGVEPTVYCDGVALDKDEVFIDEFSDDSAAEDSDGTFIANILQHDIKCFLRSEGDEVAPTELDESSIEHITGLITEGYREGELVVYDSEGTEWRGWWSLK